MVFRYRFPPNDRLRYLDGGDEEDRTIQNRIPRARLSPSLSTYASILDEVTTFGIISATPKHPRPGVSVTMQSQWGPGAHASSRDEALLEEVDIVTTITKLGRTLGFVRAEVRDPSNNDSLICHFDHVKYLPPGWVLGMVLTPVGMWGLDLFLRYFLPYFKKRSSNGIEEEQNHLGIMDSFQQTSDTTATFRYGPQHSNGFGGLHGGVQAVLMERLGKTVAQNEMLKVNSSIHDVLCERLQVSYQSSASEVLELRAHVIDPPGLDRPSITLRIEILRSHKSKDGSNDISNLKQSKRGVVSEGILTFVNASSKTKYQ